MDDENTHSIVSGAYLRRYLFCDYVRSVHLLKLSESNKWGVIIVFAVLILSLPARAIAADRYLFSFGGVDDYSDATLYINGTKAISCSNNECPPYTDITSFMIVGENTLRIVINAGVMSSIHFQLESVDQAGGTVILQDSFTPTRYDELNYDQTFDINTCTISIAAQPKNMTITSGQTATLSLTATASDPNLSYQWYQGNKGDTTTPVGTNSSTFTTPALTVTTSYWVKVSNSCNSIESDAATVTVPTPPTIDLPSWTGPSTTSGKTLGATIESSGGTSVTEAGIVYGTTVNPDISGAKVVTATTSGHFTVNVTGLTPNTVYHFRGYATNSEGTAYTADSTFTTLSNAPIATAATGTSSFTFYANWTPPSGSGAIIEYFIDVSYTPDFSFILPNYNNFQIGGSLTRVLIGVYPDEPGTKYYYRVRAVNQGGTSANSNVIMVSTYVQPIVDNPVVTSITTVGAKLGATIEPNGASITAAGIAYGKSADPDISASSSAASSTLTSGAFTVNVSGLSSNTTYHFRGFVSDALGTYYTADSTFTTVASAPTATDATKISATGFTAGWSAPSGSGTITGYRLDVAADSGFTSLLSGYNNLLVTGNTWAVTGLNAGTRYWYRVRAVNAGGTSTSSNSIPVVTQQAATIEVTLLPLASTDAGAQWKLDGGQWQNSGAKLTVLPGVHSVQFKDVAGWNTPAAQTASLTSGQTMSLTGTYVRQTGSLCVTITPAAAVSAGAEWNVDGGSWQNSGATVSNLSVGQHTVSFNTITGWDLPANQTANITNDQTASLTGIYVQQTGSLTVSITPSAAVSAGAQWAVDGGSWNASGAVVSSLSTGSHTVSYKNISGWTTPASQTVTVSNAQTTTTSGTYVSQISNMNGCYNGSWKEVDWDSLTAGLTKLETLAITSDQYARSGNTYYRIRDTGTIDGIGNNIDVLEKSTDNGNSWTTLNSPYGPMFYEIRVIGNSNPKLYLTTSQFNDADSDTRSGLWESDDLGNSWKQIVAVDGLGISVHTCCVFQDDLYYNDAEHLFSLSHSQWTVDPYGSSIQRVESISNAIAALTSDGVFMWCGSDWQLTGTDFDGIWVFGDHFYASNHGAVFQYVTGGLWQNATPTGGGWYYLSPFGAFNTNNSPWIYHQTLGWLYPVGTSTHSLWFYDPQWNGQGGWWWTSSSLFPWVYSATEGEWLYYDAKDSTLSARWFFNGTGQAATH